MRSGSFGKACSARTARVVALVATLSGVFWSGSASAEDSRVIVLGLRSVEGDDAFANTMTEALRAAAHKVSGWKVLERSVSMAQMSLAHGCDDVDATCLSDISKGLEVDRMLFGTVRRTAATRNKHDFELTVSIFNAGLRSIGVTETTVIPAAEAKQKKGLATRAEPLVAKLAMSDAGGGVLSLQVSVPSAEVKLDGQVVGQTQNYLLSLDGIREGEHRLEVSALGHLAQSQTVQINSSQRTEVKINLEPVPESRPLDQPLVPEYAESEPVSEEEQGGGSVAWLGYTLVGVGVASLAGWGVSMYIVGDTNNDATFKRYKGAFPTEQDDVCGEADANNTVGGRINPRDLSDVKSMCSTGRTFNILQWVFLGAGVLSAGIGTAILIGEAGSSEQAQASAPRLTLTPQVGRRTLGLTSTLRF